MNRRMNNRFGRNPDSFVQNLEAMYGRLTDLYLGANSLGIPQIDLLPAAFKELGNASEELQVAIEELSWQNDELVATRASLEAERQRYQELFELAPDGYLVTDIEGTIQEANRAAASLVNVSPQFLVGKPLLVFVHKDDRQSFRSQLTRLNQAPRRQEWAVRLLPRKGDPCKVSVTVSSTRNLESNKLTLRWMLRDLSARTQVEAPLENTSPQCSTDRPLHIYSKGEFIQLQPDTIWIVNKGVVKLTTICERGEEVLVGLAVPSMLFGSGITSLTTYQATALSPEVQLRCFSLAEIADSPSLAQTLLPQIYQRLRQTELLLSVAGQRRVKDRFVCLLLFLKQEMGQSVPKGTRLTVRLTHEELAAACCTTRVTITRLLGKLQEKGKIMLDCDRHLILTEGELLL